MADLEIPIELAQLQARVNAAFDAVAEHHRSVGVPVLEWPEEEMVRSAELMAAATAAADELRAAVEASGLVAEHGSYEFQAALMRASRAV
ncbi:hypothetical protein [Streptomyces sp. TR02-1]|uniref:hypothetical protein n=1 Tax=Streptomyces sp. TR02-1 TaxID=3385977 RepID=UPI0039A3F293